MKRPICRENIPQFREHALQHIRADDAYAVETFDRASGFGRLTLHPIEKRLEKTHVTQLRKQLENETTTIIHGNKLRMIEARQKIVK